MAKELIATVLSVKKLLSLNCVTTFGDQLGQYSGRIKTPDELSEMEREFGEFRVYIVEVCRDCSWNHLCSSFVLGDGIERKPPRRVRTLEDDDWVKG